MDEAVGFGGGKRCRLFGSFARCPGLLSRNSRVAIGRGGRARRQRSRGGKSGHQHCGRNARGSVGRGDALLIGKIGGKGCVGELARAAVGAGIERFALDLNLTVGGGVSASVRCQRNADDAFADQRAEFARVGHAIAVGVLPDAEFREFGIGGVELAVAIAVIGRGQALQVG